MAKYIAARKDGFTTILEAILCGGNIFNGQGGRGNACVSGRGACQVANVRPIGFGCLAFFAALPLIGNAIRMADGGGKGSLAALTSVTVRGMSSKGGHVYM